MRNPINGDIGSGTIIFSNITPQMGITIGYKLK